MYILLWTVFCKIEETSLIINLINWYSINLTCQVKKLLQLKKQLQLKIFLCTGYCLVGKKFQHFVW